MSIGSEASNPFQSPHAIPEQPVLGLSTGILEALRQTRPWVLMMGIMCFIGAAFTILGGIAFGVLMLAGTGPGGGPGGAGMPPAMGIAMAAVYLVMGVLYIFPGVFLVRYAGKIKALLASPSTVLLEEALLAQKSFWKFVGISILLVIGMYLLAIVGFVGFAIVSNV